MNINRPELNVEGKFVLLAPYSVNPNLLYRCIAIRSFMDCENDGEDVYEKYFHSRGLVDGVDGFSFAEQRQAGVMIITLYGQDGSFVYVPDSYITSQPSVGEIKYHHLILSASLGALPETFDVSSSIEELQDTIIALTGVLDAKVTLHAAPVSSNPTQDEHVAMEQTRLGHISIHQSKSQQIQALSDENARLQQHIGRLMQIIDSLGGLP